MIFYIETKKMPYSIEDLNAYKDSRKEFPVL